MPQLTNAVLKDSANADHTFIPDDIQGGVATLVESTGVPLGERRLTISKTRTSGGRHKVVAKLSVPIVQDAVVGGVSRPTVVRTAYMEVQFNFDASSVTTERGDILALAKSLLGNSMMVESTADLRGLF